MNNQLNNTQPSVSSAVDSSNSFMAQPQSQPMQAQLPAKNNSWLKITCVVIFVLCLICCVISAGIGWYTFDLANKTFAEVIDASVCADVSADDMYDNITTAQLRRSMTRNEFVQNINIVIEDCNNLSNKGVIELVQEGWVFDASPITDPLPAFQMQGPIGDRTVNITLVHDGNKILIDELEVN
jgi:hypothetical protein